MLCVCASMFTHMRARTPISCTRKDVESTARLQARLGAKSLCFIDRSLLLRGVLYILFFCTAGSTEIREGHSRHEKDQSADEAPRSTPGGSSDLEISLSAPSVWQADVGGSGSGIENVCKPARLLLQCYTVLQSVRSVF